MSLIKPPFIMFLLISLAGCASGPRWHPPAGHQKVAVAAIANPMPYQLHLGVTVFGNSLGNMDMGFDINQETYQVVRDQLVKSGRYDIVDMPVNPKDFVGASSTWTHGFMASSLPASIADPLIHQAKSLGVDYIIVVTDVRPPIMGGAMGWGLFQQGRCYDAYFDYLIFVVNAHTGATEATGFQNGFRQVKDIDPNQTWSTIPDEKRAEILADLKAIVHEDVPWLLGDIGIVSPNPVPSDRRGVVECIPRMGG